MRRSVEDDHGDTPSAASYFEPVAAFAMVYASNGVTVHYCAVNCCFAGVVQWMKFALRC